MVGIESSIQKVFLLSKLLFIFPLKLDKKGFHCSPWLTSGCMAHLFILVCGTIHCFLDRPVLSIVPIADVVLNMHLSSMVASLFLYVFYFSLSVNSLTVMLRDLKEIDTLLHDYLTTFDIDSSFKCTCSYGISVLVVGITDVCSFQDELIGTIMLYWAFFLTMILMYQFAELMEIFSIRFTILNQRIDGVMHRKLPSLSILIRLTKICRRLSECVLKANKIYSLILLSLFFSHFVGLAVNCFFLTYVRNLDIYRYLGMNFTLIAWLLLLLSNFYCVLCRIHNVTTQAKEFNIRLYQLMLCDETGLLLNDTTLQLQIASKRDITFTAAGFFKLDLTLLVAMAGAVTTYGVILIQISQRKNE
ncbi:Gustatory receptor 88b [Halyomorpha halys]|nr:Gustatory receptor 88b [Halyomorpha halys]